MSLKYPFSSVHGSGYPAVSNQSPDRLGSLQQLNMQQMMLATQRPSKGVDPFAIDNIMARDSVLGAQAWQATAPYVYGMQGKGVTPQSQRFASRASAMKENAGKGDGTIQTPAGKALVPEEFFTWAEEQRENIARAEFDDWIMAQIPLDLNEAAKEFWMAKNPKLLERKIKSVEVECEIQKKLQIMSILGPQKMEDWWFLYNLRIYYSLNSEQRQAFNLFGAPMPKLGKNVATQFFEDGKAPDIPPNNDNKVKDRNNPQYKQRKMTTNITTNGATAVMAAPPGTRTKSTVGTSTVGTGIEALGNTPNHTLLDNQGKPLILNTEIGNRG